MSDSDPLLVAGDTFALIAIWVHMFTNSIRQNSKNGNQTTKANHIFGYFQWRSSQLKWVKWLFQNLTFSNEFLKTLMLGFIKNPKEQFCVSDMGVHYAQSF